MYRNSFPLKISLVNNFYLLVNQINSGKSLISGHFLHFAWGFEPRMLHWKSTVFAVLFFDRVAFCVTSLQFV